jgi:AraC-like DNA-binding protein
MVEALEHLPMPLGYFRLILRCFGDTPERRAAILAGTGVTDDMLRDPSADISLFQQVRQIENVAALFGEGWPLRAPELWSPTSHGPLGVAGVAAPDVATMIEVITRYGFVRAPFYSASLRRGPHWTQLDFELTAGLEERHWRPMMEVSFIGIRAGIAAILAGPPVEARFFFACPEPDHAPQARAILGDDVVYGAPRNAIRLPTAWLAIQSPIADATLYDVALGELQAARARLAGSVGLRSRVERLLRSLPAGRLTADEVARLTGVSRRTLVRRLSEAGASYRELVEAELRGRAERLMRDGDLSQAQIAEQLGYTASSSFSRACRRWFGRGSPAPN